MPPNDPQAMARVTDRLAIPHICGHCGCLVKLVHNSVIYGRAFGEWPWAYQCSNQACGAYVGVHPLTDLPLGTLATALIREARKRAKAEFNPLWESGRLSRPKAYALLAERMGIPVNECHFAWFDVGRCHKALIAARELHETLRF